MTAEQRLASFMDSLTGEEHTFATRLLEMGADYPLIFVAVHLDRRITEMNRPPWKGLPHAFTGAAMGAITAWLASKGIHL
jgi:hypothetical protein